MEVGLLDSINKKKNNCFSNKHCLVTGYESALKCCMQC